MVCPDSMKVFVLWYKLLFPQIFMLKSMKLLLPVKSLGLLLYNPNEQRN